MNIGSLVFLFAVCVIDRIIQKKFPRFYKQIQLPTNIVLSILVAVYCGFCGYAVYDVLISNVLIGDKIFFVIFMGIIVSLYVILLVIEWKRWWKDHKADDSVDLEQQ